MTSNMVSQRQEVDALLAAVNRGEQSVVVQPVRLADGSLVYHLRPVVRAAPAVRECAPASAPPLEPGVPRPVWWLIGVTVVVALVAVAWLIWAVAHFVAANASLVIAGVLLVALLAAAGRGCHIVVQHWR